MRRAIIVVALASASCRDPGGASTSDGTGDPAADEATTAASSDGGGDGDVDTSTGSDATTPATDASTSESSDDGDVPRECGRFVPDPAEPRAGGQPGNAWSVLATDPAATPRAWFRTHWVPTTQSILVWGGNSHDPVGDNSVRLFDPLGLAWTELLPNTNGASGLQNRDNHVAFYVPSCGEQGELWAFGGSYNTNGADQYGGRFDVATREWIVVAHSEAEFAEGLIADFAGPGQDAGHAWCPMLDTGVVFGGGGAGNADGTTIVIEPNADGPEPYRMTRTIPDPSPHSRWRQVASMVCVDDQIYMYGGEVQIADELGNVETVAFDDLWRLDVPTRQWTQLASGGQGGPDLVTTHDPIADVLVVQGRSDVPGKDVWIYEIASDSWCDMTATATPSDGWPQNAMSHAGVYAPTIGAHVYLGGIVYGADFDSGSGVAGAVVRAYTVEGG